MMAPTAQLSTTDYAVLAALSLSPMSGYELRDFISTSIGNFWNESFGQLYPALKRLEAAALARSADKPTGKRPRKVYSITAAGRRAARAWLAQPPLPQPPRSELLLKIFFAHQISPAQVAAHIALLTQQSQALLQRYRSIAAALKLEHPRDPRLRFWLATVRFGELRCQAELAWCTETRKSLLPRNNRPTKETP